MQMAEAVENLFRPAALRNVADDAAVEGPLVGLPCRERQFDRKFIAILAQSLQLNEVANEGQPRLFISNVPGPQETHYWNGAKLTGSVRARRSARAAHTTCSTISAVERLRLKQ